MGFFSSSTSLRSYFFSPLNKRKRKWCCRNQTFLSLPTSSVSSPAVCGCPPHSPIRLLKPAAARIDDHLTSLSEMVDESFSIQLIDGDGALNTSGLESFIRNVKLAECGLSYAVVSIMGPQSSGKSTLLNHLFHTNFREMDALTGRFQTTRGIWMAKCTNIDPCTLVMDLEGTDGRERGEDDTAFEKQSALFALAVSDIVLINMWCHDIGREQAANKPLLKTVFQVMMRLFSPRRTTLMFVIRDKTKTPLETLEPILREDIQKIWDTVAKPNEHKETPLSDFFRVEIVALSSYEEKEEQFKEQVANLRQKFFNSIAPGGLAGDRGVVVPGSGFLYSSQQIWKIIKENKDLDLPAHKVMVATVRCEEIANEMLAAFNSDENWQQLQEACQTDLVPGFGKKTSQILGSYLSGYDMEAGYFDESVKAAKKEHMQSKLLQLVQPAYQSILGHLRSKTLDDLKEALDKALDGGKVFALAARDCTETFMSNFDEGCEDAAIEQAKWDSSKTREKLKRDIDAHVASVRSAKLAELSSLYEENLKTALEEPAEALLDNASDDTWPSIRKLLQRETNLAVIGLSSALSAFDINENTRDKMISNLEAYGRGIVESKAKEEAGRALIRMKDRFATLFCRDADSMPRMWTGKEDIRSITKNARSSSLKLLSVLSAIRLDDRNDNIEKTLSLALLGPAKRSSTDRDILSIDPLASGSWAEVPSSKTLITPVQCKSLWRQFKAETEYSVTQAIAAQEANRRNSNWLPPPWAILAIVILGFNEFMTLLRHPFYIGILFVIFLLAKALWVQLNIKAEFNNGALPGIISVSTKFIPTILNIIKRLADAGYPTTPPEQRRVPELVSKSARNPIQNSLSSSERLAMVTSKENEAESSGQ